MLGLCEIAGFHTYNASSRFKIATNKAALSYSCLLHVQVKTSILKSGKKIESDIVIVGVGAKPNTDMFKGQIDLLEDKPGGIKVEHTAYMQSCIQSLQEA